MQNILLTICARGGSKGIKNKNIRLLQGKPLIYYTIKQAIGWGRAKHIIVSTDSRKIAILAKKYGAEVPFLRPKTLASDTSSKLDAIRHAMNISEKLFGENFDTIIDLDPTSPIRKIEDLNKSLTIFNKVKPDTLFSVTHSRKNPYFNMIEKNIKGIYLSKKTRRIHRRQDAPPVFDMNASIYIYRREYLKNLKNSSPISKRSDIYIMDEYSSVDIDREMDFHYIEFLIEKGLVTI
ncbi:MAG: acylneuraminate cytidylyltransferase family protein [Bacteroidota bacterium]|jgi:CMP-N-acetylneuraminic acid synthetase